MSFKDKVISIVKKIPYGRITTYGSVATLAGLPRGARLVAGILHAEEETLPWQRIINKDGFISIRGCHYTKDFQKKLLEQEGIEVTADFMIDLKKYGWFSLRHPERLAKDLI